MAVAGCVGPLGSDSEPEFSVSIRETNAPVLVGDVLEVRVRVRNESDTEGKKTVTYQIGEYTDTSDVTLEPDSVSDIEFRARLEGEPGVKEVLVETEFSAATESILVQRVGYSDFAINILSYTEELADGEEFTVTALVQNDGESQATEELQLLFDGIEEPVATESITLDAGGSERIELSWETVGVSDSESFKLVYDDAEAEESITVSETDG